MREAISRKSGREFWRSLEELAGTDKFRDFLHREFPALNAPETDPSMLDSNGRRNFMKLMGASLALAGLTACTRQPKEFVVPYVKTPDGLVPGKTQFYATAMPQGGVLFADYLPWSMLHYLQVVDGQRPDVEVVILREIPTQVPEILTRRLRGALYLADTYKYYDVEGISRYFDIVPEAPLYRLRRKANGELPPIP